MGFERHELEICSTWAVEQDTSPSTDQIPHEVWTLVPPARLAEHGLTLSVVALSAADTERRRLGKWRVLPELASYLPSRCSAMASGRQSATEERP
jgi:hypothetical protein